MQNQDKRWYSSSCGRIELTMSLEQAESVSGSGEQTGNVQALLKQQNIIDQTKNIDNNVLYEIILEIFYDSDDDLNDHESNIERLIWLAGCDITENTRTLKEEIQAKYPEYTDDHFSSHASDLHILLGTPDMASKLLSYLHNEYEFPKNIERFISDVEGQAWYKKACLDIPFAANCPASGKPE